MDRLRTTHILTLATLSGLVAGDTCAEVREFDDKQAWIDAVDEFATVRFTEFPPGTYITDQYSKLGVVFTDGNDNAVPIKCGAPNDLWGLDGNAAICLTFMAPLSYLGTDHPGLLQIDLFRDGRLLYSSSTFPGSGSGFFAGVASTELFDTAIITDWIDDQVNIDDLFFGPAPTSPDLEIQDCDDSGWVDLCDVELFAAPDCNDNLNPDSCDIDTGFSLDCNGNGVPDECDIDCNGNGLPDDCETPPCPEDVADDDCDVNCDDLLAVILDWSCTSRCTGDTDGDGSVGVRDLINVILAWGPCAEKS